MSATIEKRWTHVGFECIVKLVDAPHSLHRCGYVRVSDDHPWFSLGSQYVDADVHGGITFCGELSGMEGRWVGFDCGHVFDYPNEQLHDHDPTAQLVSKWTLEDACAETEKLALQASLAQIRKSTLPRTVELSLRVLKDSSYEIELRTSEDGYYATVWARTAAEAVESAYQYVHAWACTPPLFENLR